MIEDYTVVDGHVHTFMSEDISARIQRAFNRLYEIEFDNSGPSTIEDVELNMKRLGIDFTVMTNFAPAKIIHDNNLWTLEAYEKNPSLVPLVSFHPEMEGNMCELLESYIAKGARGIKLHPMAQGFNPDQELMQDLYGLCNEIGLPIVFHCGRVANARLNEFADAGVILPIVDRYPGIPFVLTHMVDGNAEDVVRISKLYPNVYFDTSIVVTGYPPIIETNEASWLDDGFVIDVIEAVGAERVIFGSDYPWGNPAYDLPRLLNLKLGKEQKRCILGTNALKLYKLG